MENITKKETIDSIVADKAFLKKIIGLNSIEEVKEAFKEKGLELSDEDIKVLGKIVKCQIENPANVSEDTLEKTTGGWSDPEFKKFKNISMGITALAIGLSTVCITATINRNVNGPMTDFKDSWLWKALTFRGENTFIPPGAKATELKK